jgi:hypothetical protein
MYRIISVVLEAYSTLPEAFIAITIPPNTTACQQMYNT